MLETKLEECFEVSSKDDGLEQMHTIQLVRSLLIDLPCVHVFLETRCLLNRYGHTDQKVVGNSNDASNIP